MTPITMLVTVDVLRHVLNLCERESCYAYLPCCWSLLARAASCSCCLLRASRSRLLVSSSCWRFLSLSRRPIRTPLSKSPTPGPSLWISLSTRLITSVSMGISRLQMERIKLNILRESSGFVVGEPPPPAAPAIVSLDVFDGTLSAPDN